jgi:hypothetical protein
LKPVRLRISLRPESKYHDKRYFSPFLRLLSSKYSRARKVVQKIRNAAAFHLDSDGKTTGAALAKLERETHSFISFSGDNEVQIGYFDLADLIDAKHLIEVLRDGRDDEEEVFSEILDSIMILAREIASASESFLVGLSVQLKLIKDAPNSNRDPAVPGPIRIINGVGF